MSKTSHARVRSDASPRERILDTAYELFARRGIGAVGVDEVVERAGIAKATLYRHFPSKNELVLAFLERRESVWTRQFLEAAIRSRGSTPDEHLLAIFDVYDEWFHSEDFEACSFVNVLLEMGPAHPAGHAAAEHLRNIRAMVRELAEEAGLRDPEAFARSWYVLMKGSIVLAAEGEVEAAGPAKVMARTVIEKHKPMRSYSRGAAPK